MGGGGGGMEVGEEGDYIPIATFRQTAPLLFIPAQYCGCRGRRRTSEMKGKTGKGKECEPRQRKKEV